jgi:hypothetical protein
MVQVAQVVEHLPSKHEVPKRKMLLQFPNPSFLVYTLGRLLRPLHRVL